MGLEQKLEDSGEEDETVVDVLEEVWIIIEEIIEVWSEDGWTNEVLEGSEPKVIKWSKNETSIRDLLKKNDHAGERDLQMTAVSEKPGQDSGYFSTVVPSSEFMDGIEKRMTWPPHKEIDILKDLSTVTPKTVSELTDPQTQNFKIVIIEKSVTWPPEYKSEESNQ